jgi:hypothetical protein
MFDPFTLKSARTRTDTPRDGPLRMGVQIHSGGAVKARIFRATLTAAMLAAVVQAFGAAIKW